MNPRLKGVQISVQSKILFPKVIFQDISIIVNLCIRIQINNVVERSNSGSIFACTMQAKTTVYITCSDKCANCKFKHVLYYDARYAIELLQNNL